MATFTATADTVLTLLNDLEKTADEHAIPNFIRGREVSSLGSSTTTLAEVMNSVPSFNNNPIISQKFFDIMLKGLKLAGGGSSEILINFHVYTDAILSFIPSDLSVSETASSLFVDIVRVNHLNSKEEIMDRMMDAVKVESSKVTGMHQKLFLMRYANIFAQVMAIDDRCFASCRRCGALELILDLCHSDDDILTQTVAIGMLTLIAKTSAGLSYLFREPNPSNALVNWLILKVQQDGDGVVGSEALRVLGNIFSGCSALQFDYQSDTAIEAFLHCVALRLEGRIDSDRLAGLHAFTSFASSSNRSLELVLTKGGLMEAWSSLLKSAKVELVAAALVSLAHVFALKARVANGHETGSANSSSSASAGAESGGVVAGVEGDDAARVSGLKKTFLARLSAAKGMPAAAYLLKVARQPVAELKLASFGMLTAMCKESWGLLEIFGGAPELREFLLDSSTEHSKECKEAKFNLLCTIVESPQFEAFMSADLCMSFRKQVARGPFYRAATVEGPQVLEH